MVGIGIFLTAGLAGCLASAASPSLADTFVGSFTITQRQNPDFIPNGPLALYRAIVKYGRTPPNDLFSLISQFLNTPFTKRKVSGSTTNYPQAYDSAYYAQVTVGSPPQKLSLNFDSGSSDLWVFSSAMPAAQSQGHNTYNPSLSSSSRLKTGYAWSITYGDGSSAKGTVYLDTVTIGNAAATGQAVETATAASGEFTADTSVDGILGLAFSSINTVSPSPQKTWFETIKGNLNSPVWTADLKNGIPGTYSFGSINASAYTGKLYYANVDNSNGFWSFPVDNVRIGTGSYAGLKFSGIADTGTSIALLPAAVVKAYYKAVSGAKFSSDYSAWIFPCSTALPNFSFTVGGGEITVPGKYISYGAVDNTNCYGAIQSDEDVGLSIIGDTMLKSAYVVFELNGSAPRIGWAKKTLN